MATQTYNRSEITKSAWNLVKTGFTASFSIAMKQAWAEAKVPKVEVIEKEWNGMKFENKALFFKKSIQKLMLTSSKEDIMSLIPETTIDPKTMLQNLSLKRFEEILNTCGGYISRKCPLTGKSQFEIIL